MFRKKLFPAAVVRFLEIKRLFVALLIFLWNYTGLAASNELVDDKYQSLVAPYLKTFCLKCHRGVEAEAGFRIDRLSSDVGLNVDAWQDMFDRISSGQMPPAHSGKQPNASETTRLIQWLNSAIDRANVKNLARRGPMQFNRMTNQEYLNTIRDLLGVKFHEKEIDLVENQSWNGIRKVGSVQTISAVHIERYLGVAEKVIDEVFLSQQTGSIVRHFDAIDLAGGEALYGSQLTKSLKQDIETNPVRVDLWPGQTIALDVEQNWIAGKYRFTLQLSGLQSIDNRPPHLTISDLSDDRILFEKGVVTTESKSTKISFDVHISGGRHEFKLTNGVNGPLTLLRLDRTKKPFYSTVQGYLPWQVSFLDSKGNAKYPCLILDWVQIEGPLVSQEGASKRNLFVPQSDDLMEVRQCLNRFVESAYRRPVKAHEMTRYYELVNAEIAKGKSVKTATKTAMIAVLCSKEFIYLIEGSPERRSVGLTNYELASRLSYFLWSSTPDEELLKLAKLNQLSNENVLRKQVKRLLADPRSNAFVADFSRQWLRLDEVGRFKPNSELYPEFDGYLQRSMIEESKLFFNRLLRENLSLRELIISDWTILNPRLALHYQIDLNEKPYEDRFRVVELKPADNRGGVLTHGSILSMTSDGLRHRPVHRGVWLTETLLGQSTPPPPANVAAIEPNPPNGIKRTIRGRLESHSRDVTCSSCHSRIDPYGFAFENYDAIGRWRTIEKFVSGLGEDPLVDASGVLPTGESFSDVNQFRQLLLKDFDLINEAFVKTLATYATRRLLTDDDQAALKKLAEISSYNDYRLGDLVESIVVSPLFLQR